MSESILSVTGLTKSFPGNFSFRTFSSGPGKFAVNHISFSVAPGEIVGLLGPNGAGKTTTIQMLLGTMSKTSGSIKYFGTEFDDDRSAILGQMNYASAYTKLPWHLTVFENLNVYAHMYNIPSATPRIKKLLAQFGMSDYLHAPIRSLSAGQTTRVILAKAFINYPKIILLDEPTASLDPDSAASVRQFLLKQQSEYNVAMLFTSHNMAEVTEVCDRVLFIQKGQIVAENSPQGLARELTHTKIHLTIESISPSQISDLRAAGVDFTHDQLSLTIRTEEHQIASILHTLTKLHLHYTEISIDKPTLEDYFLNMSRKGKM